MPVLKIAHIIARKTKVIINFVFNLHPLFNNFNVTDVNNLQRK